MSLLRNKIRKIRLLIGFEFIKLFRQKRAYAGLAVILIFILLFSLSIYLHQQNAHSGQGKFEGRLIKELFNGIAFSEMMLLPAMYILFPMAVGIISVGVLAGEWENGQLRAVALRPVSRWTIYLSKFVSMGIYCFCLFAILLLLSYGLGAAIFGFSGDVIIVGPAFFGQGAKLFILPEEAAWQRLFLSYSLAVISTISISAFFLMFSAILKKMSIAIVIPLGIYYTSYILGGLPLTENLQRFLPTRYIDVWKYTLAQTINWNIVLQRGGFLLLYTLGYLIIGGIVFSNADL